MDKEKGGQMPEQHVEGGECVRWTLPDKVVVVVDRDDDGEKS